MRQIDFKNFLGPGVIRVHHFHHLFHLLVHPLLANHQRRRRIDQAFGRNHILDFVAQSLLENLDERIGQIFTEGFFFLFLIPFDIQVSFVDGVERLLIVFIERRHNEHIERIRQKQDFQFVLSEIFEIGISLKLFPVFPGEVVNLFLILFHPRHVVLQGSEFALIHFRRFESQQVDNSVFVREV